MNPIAVDVPVKVPPIPAPRLSVAPPPAEATKPPPPTPAPKAEAPAGSWQRRVARTFGLEPTRKQAWVAAAAALSLVAGVAAVRMVGPGTGGLGAPAPTGQPVAAEPRKGEAEKKPEPAGAVEPAAPANHEPVADATPTATDATKPATGGGWDAPVKLPETPDAKPSGSIPTGFSEPVRPPELETTPVRVEPPSGLAPLPPAEPLMPEPAVTPPAAPGVTPPAALPPVVPAGGADSTPTPLPALPSGPASPPTLPMPPTGPSGSLPAAPSLPEPSALPPPTDTGPPPAAPNLPPLPTPPTGAGTPPPGAPTPPRPESSVPAVQPAALPARETPVSDPPEGTPASRPAAPAVPDPPTNLVPELPAAPLVTPEAPPAPDTRPAGVLPPPTDNRPADVLPPDLTPKTPAPERTPPARPTKIEFTKPATGASKPGGVPERAPQTSFDVDLYEPRSGDSYESISREFYNETRYARALAAYNRNTPLQTIRMVEVPPIHILKQRYAPLAGGTAATPTLPAEWVPASATTTDPAPAFRASSARTFSVPPGGMSMREVARQVFGTDKRWQEVYDLNPQFAPDLIPGGSVLKLPPEAIRPR